MKLRIKQKHNGEYYYYIIEKLGLFGWKRPTEFPINRTCYSCKEADEVLENYHLRMTTDEVILEREYKF